MMTNISYVTLIHIFSAGDTLIVEVELTDLLQRDYSDEYKKRVDLFEDDSRSTHHIDVYQKRRPFIRPKRYRLTIPQEGLEIKAVDAKKKIKGMPYRNWDLPLNDDQKYRRKKKWRKREPAWAEQRNRTRAALARRMKAEREKEEKEREKDEKEETHTDTLSKNDLTNNTLINNTITNNTITNNTLNNTILNNTTVDKIIDTKTKTLNTTAEEKKNMSITNTTNNNTKTNNKNTNNKNATNKNTTNKNATSSAPVKQNNATKPPKHSDNKDEI